MTKTQACLKIVDFPPMLGPVMTNVVLLFSPITISFGTKYFIFWLIQGCFEFTTFKYGTPLFSLKPINFGLVISSPFKISIINELIISKKYQNQQIKLKTFLVKIFLK